jgi:EAL domain-containing protein (putative c-di-GMP-specific phosphodiesterase class I)
MPGEEGIKSQLDVVEEVVAAGPRIVYQPIVDLERRTVVGYEALCRAKPPLERPLELFAAARSAGRLADVDWACRAAALHGAFKAGLRPPLKLFINVEPEALVGNTPDEVRELADAALRELDIVVEFTERAISAAPAQLLRAVHQVRRRGASVAIDDIGTGPGPLALVPLLRPDVVKLDMDLVHAPKNANAAQVAAAVGAFAEAEGAAVVAEGIETEAHLMSAIALGATLGQGWLFGRPAPLPDVLPAPVVQVPIGVVPPRPAARSPAALVGRHVAMRRGEIELVRELGAQLLAQADELGQHAVVAASVAARPTGPAVAALMRPLARNAALVAVLGADADLPGAHLGPVAPEDPLAREWNLAVLGPYFSGALVARELDGGPPDACDFALTHDPRLVFDVAELLLARAVN